MCCSVSVVGLHNGCVLLEDSAPIAATPRLVMIFAGCDPPTDDSPAHPPRSIPEQSTPIGEAAPLPRTLIALQVSLSSWASAPCVSGSSHPLAHSLCTVRSRRSPGLKALASRAPLQVSHSAAGFDGASRTNHGVWNEERGLGQIPPHYLAGWTRTCSCLLWSCTLIATRH